MKFVSFAGLSATAAVTSVLFTISSVPASALSAGCTALNGHTQHIHVTAGGAPTNVSSSAAFEAGEQVTIIATGDESGDGLGYRVLFNDGTTDVQIGSAVHGLVGTVNGPYAIPSTATGQIRLEHLSASGTTIAGDFQFACVAGAGPAAATQNSSALIDQARQQLSKLAVNTSSTSTSESVLGAINDAFTGGGTTQASDGRIATSFAAIENAANKEDADDARGAYAALGYNKAGASKMVTKAPPPVAYRSPWHVWVDARYTSIDDKRVSSFDAHQTNVTGGISYKFSDTFLLGLVTGYEDFNYELGFRNAKLDGTGWNGGGYFGWKFWDRLRLDGMLTYGRISYGAQADTVTAGFDANRITSMLRLSGRYGLAAGWYVEPSARLIYANERQDAFVDTAGVAHAKYSFDVGLGSFGGEVGAPVIFNTWIVTPTVGVFGDYRFGNDTVQSVATLPNIDDGWSARVTGGLRWTALNGFSTSIGGEYGGLGSDTRFWRAKGSLGYKF